MRELRPERGAISAAFWRVVDQLLDVASVGDELGGAITQQQVRAAAGHRRHRSRDRTDAPAQTLRLDRRPASTITLTPDSAAISRPRDTNRCRVGTEPGGTSLTSRPTSAIRSSSSR